MGSHAVGGEPRIAIARIASAGTCTEGSLRIPRRPPGRGRARLLSRCIEPVGPLEEVRAEVAAAEIESPGILAATRLDDAEPDALARLRLGVRDLRVIGVSILDDASLDRLRDAVWELTGLLRVFARRPGAEEAGPLAMTPGATAADVAGVVHGDLGRRCRGAHIWGSSTRLPGQFVGRDHLVADDDVVEVIA